MGEKKHYLITGATGFVGGRFSTFLKETNLYSQITTSGRNRERSQHLSNSGFRHISGDLRDSEFFKKLIPGVNTVIHCAALSSPWGRARDFHEMNVEVTRNLINACFTHRVDRLVFISTAGVYTSFKDRTNIKESDTVFTHRLNHYAATKYKAEKLVLDAGKKGLPVVIIRPRAVAGKGDLVVMPRILKAHQAGRLKIIGPDDKLADITSAGNLAEAILLAAESGKDALGQVFNITNGDPIPLRLLLQNVLSGLGLELDEKRLPYPMAYGLASILEFIAKMGLTKEPILTKYGVSLMAYSTTLNIDKAKRLLGYVPRQSNEETIGEFISWWEKHH